MNMKNRFKRYKTVFKSKLMDSNMPYKEQQWIKWMQWGARLGCHQKPERSFFINGYQFPVCARCTGVLIASTIACIVFIFKSISLKYCIFMCAIMFSDWFIQRIGIRESTNTRRLITGLVGGFGFMTLQLYAYQLTAFWIMKKIYLLF